MPGNLKIVTGADQSLTGDSSMDGIYITSI